MSQNNIASLKKFAAKSRKSICHTQIPVALMDKLHNMQNMEVKESKNELDVNYTEEIDHKDDKKPLKLNLEMMN